MELVSQNLVVLIRDTPERTREVLVGTKKRGEFKGMTVFPGGKAEGSEPAVAEAAREVAEEVGITVRPETMRYAGKLLLRDNRLDSRRFGNVFIYVASVPPDTNATETEELAPAWEPVDSGEFIDRMPPDVACWWPAVRNFDGAPKITHVIHQEDGTLEIITKEPDFQNSQGAVLSTRIIPGSS